MKPQTVFEASFDADQVPCAPVRDGALRELVWQMGREGSHPDSVARAQAIIDGAPEHPNELHRYLLAARRDRSTWGWVQRGVEGALDHVREHSRLYTPRTCVCLRKAFDAFASDVETQLRRLDDAPVPRCRAWVSETGWGSDIDEALQFKHITQRLGGGAWRLFDTRLPPRIAVSVDTAGVVTVTFGTRRRGSTQQRRIVPLTAEQAALADRIRYGSGRGMYWGAGGWVRTWSPALLEAGSAWVLRPNQSDEERRAVLDDAKTLVAAESDLGPGGLRTLARLAPGWPGTLESLIETAEAVAAPVGSPA